MAQSRKSTAQMRKAMVSDAPDQHGVTPTISDILPASEDDSDDGEWILLPRIPPDMARPDLSGPTSRKP